MLVIYLQLVIAGNELSTNPQAVLEGSVVRGDAWFTSSFPNKPYEVQIPNSPVKVRVQIVEGTNEKGEGICESNFDIIIKI